MKKILLAGVALSMLYATSAFAMITVTKHNFSDGSGGGSRSVYLTTSGAGNEVNGEVCVFCHTPHGATADAPLWNRKMATSGAYTPYTSSTLDAPGADASRQPKGVSLACLSCHDGTIAIDALRNAPGSGNYDTTAAARSWTWTGLTSGKLNSGVITNLSQNLTSQHPISIEYPKYAASNYDEKFYAPNAVHSSGARYFDDDADSKMDDNEVRLYATNGDSKVYVECASCHNPHGTEGSPAGPDGVNFATFLRMSNSQSALCTKCHIK